MFNNFMYKTFIETKKKHFFGLSTQIQYIHENFLLKTL